MGKQKVGLARGVTQLQASFVMIGSPSWLGQLFSIQTARSGQSEHARVLLALAMGLTFCMFVISSITVVMIPVFLGIHSFAVPLHMQVWLLDDSRSDPKGLTEAYWRILKLLLRGQHHINLHYEGKVKITSFLPLRLSNLKCYTVSDFVTSTSCVPDGWDRDS